MNLEPLSGTERTRADYTPSLDDVPITSDPGSALLALLLKARSTESTAARGEVNHAFDRLEEARRQMQEALERAREADEKSGFWGTISSVFSGDIASIAEVVATAAAIVATGGAGAAGILALAATGMSVGADVAAKLGVDPKLCMLIAAGGAVAGLAVGRLDVGSGVWADVAKGARITNTAATTAGSGAGVVAENYRADSMSAQADAVTARGARDDAVFRFNQALEVLEKCARDVQRADNLVATMSKNEADGNSAVLARMRAA
jgi:hypothetical protein